MIPEARLKDSGAGLVPESEGWFVMNAREARWIEKPGQGHSLPLTGKDEYSVKYLKYTRAHLAEAKKAAAAATAKAAVAA